MPSAFLSRARSSITLVHFQDCWKGKSDFRCFGNASVHSSCVSFIPKNLKMICVLIGSESACLLYLVLSLSPLLVSSTFHSLHVHVYSFDSTGYFISLQMTCVFISIFPHSSCKGDQRLYFPILLHIQRQYTLNHL